MRQIETAATSDIGRRADVRAGFLRVKKYLLQRRDRVAMRSHEARELVAIDRQAAILAALKDNRDLDR